MRAEPSNILKGGCGGLGAAVPPWDVGKTDGLNVFFKESLSGCCHLSFGDSASRTPHPSELFMKRSAFLCALNQNCISLVFTSV